MKLMKALVVLLVAAGLIVPAVAIAEDRLSLSGQMRVRGWHVDQDTDNGSDTWADQRLRIAGKIAVAEGVSITFRTDITETTWGNGGSEFGAGRMGGTQQWDRAHLDLSMGSLHLRAGQQYLGTGGTFAFDTQDAGLSFDVVGAVPVKVFAVLDDTNGSNADAFQAGVIVNPKPFKLFAVMQDADMNLAEQVYLLGASGAFDFDAVKLFAELDFFTGDHNASTDAMGAQTVVDVSVAAGSVTVGGQFFYALGADAGEKQYTLLGNGFNGYDPVYDVGTSLSNESIDLSDNGKPGGRVFDFTGAGAGVVGARVYGMSKMSDAVSLGGSVAYLMSEDDDVADAEMLALAFGVKYALMANTSLQAQLQYTDYEEDNFNDEDDWLEAGVGLFVNF